MAFDAGGVERTRVEDGVEEEEDAAVERMTALVGGMRMWEV